MALIFIAAGLLLSHAVHELAEIGVITFGTETAFDISGILPHEGEGFPALIGSLLRALFGYTSTPEWITSSPLGYIVIVLPFYLRPVKPAEATTRPAEQTAARALDRRRQSGTATPTKSSTRCGVLRGVGMLGGGPIEEGVWGAGVDDQVIRDAGRGQRRAEGGDILGRDAGIVVAEQAEHGAGEVRGAPRSGWQRPPVGLGRRSVEADHPVQAMAFRK